MEKELFDYIAERVDILAVSGASRQETMDKAAAWKEAVAGADDAAIEAATAEFADYLMGRLATIDDVIAFAQGPAVEMLGAEAAAQMLEAQQQRKAAGEKYCNCEAHVAATEILAKLGRIEL